MIGKIVFGVVNIILLLSVAFPVHATIGVGVGTGKIAVEEHLKAGGIYTLPSIVVFNTGTEEATYEMAMTFNAVQPQHKPSAAWVEFSPQQFTLKPKQSQTVGVKLRPPVRVTPGDYFAYLEARPAKTVKQGGTSVGIAAATKLSFTLDSANIFMALWYRLFALYQQYLPWTKMFIIVLGLTLAWLVARRYLGISLTVKKRRSDDADA